MTDAARCEGPAVSAAGSGNPPALGARPAAPRSTPSESFCEACGPRLTPTAADAGRAADAAGVADRAVPGYRPTSPAAAEPTVAIVRPCLACGGVVGADGYCETCGTKAPSERDHYVEQPAGWVAACCDRGVRHHRNEDATAIAAAPARRAAVLVVCDGVSTSEASDVASLAAARAARDVLVANRPAGSACRASRVAALEAALVTAADAGQRRGAWRPRRSTRPTPPSCTFVAAVLEGSLVVHGNIGDSRAYWIPDPGRASRCCSASTTRCAQLRIAAGVPREEAEVGPQAHAITRWLGRDAPDVKPSTGSRTADRRRLAAGLLRRPVELRLRGRRPAGPGRASCPRPSAASRCSSRRRSSAGPTTRAARTTSPSRWPDIGLLDRSRGICLADPAPRRELTWPSSPPRCTRTSSCPTAPPTSTRSSR